jgi:hypothetical protein
LITIIKKIFHPTLQTIQCLIKKLSGESNRNKSTSDESRSELIQQIKQFKIKASLIAEARQRQRELQESLQTNTTLKALEKENIPQDTNYNHIKNPKTHQKLNHKHNKDDNLQMINNIICTSLPQHYKPNHTPSPYNRYYKTNTNYNHIKNPKIHQTLNHKHYKDDNCQMIHNINCTSLPKHYKPNHTPSPYNRYYVTVSNNSIICPSINSHHQPNSHNNLVTMNQLPQQAKSALANQEDHFHSKCIQSKTSYHGKNKTIIYPTKSRSSTALITRPNQPNYSKPNHRAVLDTKPNRAEINNTTLLPINKFH